MTAHEEQQQRVVGVRAYRVVSRSDEWLIPMLLGNRDLLAAAA